MRRASRSVRVNLGPLSFAPPKRRAKRPRARPVPAQAVENGGYPDTATWAVAVMLDDASVRIMASEARGEAACYPTANSEALAVTLLAIELAQHARAVVAPEGLPVLARHLVEVGIGGVDWDAIARKALT
jgi:hypothetical protein